MRTALSFSLILASTVAVAAPVPPDAFYTLAVASKAKCYLQAENGRLTGDNAALEKCLASEEADNAGYFKQTISGIRPQSGKAAVKRFYACWLTAMSGLKSRPGETEDEYSARQDQADHELEELGNAMKVEALSD